MVEKKYFPVCVAMVTSEESFDVKSIQEEKIRNMSVSVRCKKGKLGVCVRFSDLNTLYLCFRVQEV